MMNAIRRHSPVLLALGLVAGLCSLAGAVRAQPEDETLRVLVRIAPPFVIEDRDGDVSGLSIDLWRAIAEDLQLVYRFEAAGLEEMLEEVAAGRAAVGVGATTVTAEREQRLDFTHPFVSTGLAIATRSGGSAWTAVLQRVFSADFGRAVAALAIVLLGVGALVWLFERRANPEEFQPEPRRGLWSSFWFAAVSMTTVGYGDKAPRSVGGRIVALVWMFASIILISFFTAAIATALTVQSLASGIDGPEDLDRVGVAAVENTTAAAYLRERGIEARTHPTPEAAMRALSRGEVEAVVHDEPILQWVKQEAGYEDVQLLPRVIERQDYAFVLPSGSERREAINRALLEEIESDRFRRAIERALGD